MKSAELREMETQALLDNIESKREELFRLRIAWSANRLEDPNQMRIVRKDIARMLTVVRERELAASYIGGESNA
jgi:large subunit ribosomal protein L29